MIVYGATRPMLIEAMAEASAELAHNLQFNREPVPVGKGYRLTIRCVRARDDAGELAPGVVPGRSLNRDGRVRATTSADWDAHGLFLAHVFRHAPRARIITHAGVIDGEEAMIEHWPKAALILEV